MLILKAYAITALMKIYAFEIAAGRKVDMLPEVGFLLSTILMIPVAMQIVVQPYVLGYFASHWNLAEW